jgi:hypothetical protein
LRAAHRLDRHGRGAIGLRAEAYRSAPAHALNLVAHEAAHGACHHERRVLRRGDLGGRGIRRSHPFRVRARPSTRRLELLVADVIAVHVGEQHEMDRAQPRIVATGHIVRRVVQEAHARRILKNDRAIVRAQLARVRADRSDFHVLSAGRSYGQKEREGCACVCSVFMFCSSGPVIRTRSFDGRTLPRRARLQSTAPRRKEREPQPKPAAKRGQKQQRTQCRKADKGPGRAGQPAKEECGCQDETKHAHSKQNPSSHSNAARVRIVRDFGNHDFAAQRQG